MHYLSFRFSGISEEDLEDVTTTLRDVQAVLLSLFTAHTILIGHSLESDLTALKVCRVVKLDVLPEILVWNKDMFFCSVFCYLDEDLGCRGCCCYGWGVLNSPLQEGRQTCSSEYLPFKAK